MLRPERSWSDSGWIGADEDDDLDQRLAGEAEPFDPDQPHVMTALGPISPESLGPTLVDDQVLGWRLANDLDERGLPGRASLLTADHLRAFTDAGGGSIVAATTAGGGRDSPSLRWLAAWTSVHLIIATGGGSGEIAPSADAGETATTVRSQAMIEEMITGIDGTACRAGIILIELQHAILTSNDTAWLTAAANAAMTIGSGITLTIDHPAAALPALAHLADQGIDLSRLMVACRAGDSGSDVAGAILAAGATLIVDALVAGPTVGNPQTAMILEFVTRGYGSQVLLGAGTIGRNASEGNHRSSWVTILEWLPIQLMDGGLDAMTVRRLLVENPARMLTIKRGAR